MRRLPPVLVALALFVAPAYAAAPPAGSDLSTRIDAVTHRPEYASARWGILVVDPATGATVFERNADQLFAPASVTKLFSCAAAWVGLGPTQESGQRHAQNFLYRSAWQGTVNGEERSRVARRLGDHLRGRIDHEQQPVLNGTRHVDGLAIAGVEAHLAELRSLGRHA